MAETFIQLPADGAGKKLRAKSKTVAAQVVHEQFVCQAADPTYYVWVPPMAMAANKYTLAVLNTAAEPVRVRKLFLINGQLVAVTGVGVQFDIKRISSITGGTAVTPNPADTTDGAISGLTCVHSPTSVTEGVLLFSWFTTNDEIGVTNAFPSSYVQATNNLICESAELKEPVLQQNQGLCVKQITSTTVGLYGVLAVITKEI